jgi:O-antigen/teichoic acid export membrane protein
VAWLKRAHLLVSRARRGILGSVAVLAGGTALSQAFTVLVSPILTRLYGPEDLGRLGLYTAFANLALVATSLRYEYGIVGARNTREAAYLTLIALAIVCPVSVLLSVGLFLLIRGGLVGYDGLPAVASGFMLLTLLVTGGTGVLRYWFVRQESFGTVARVLVWQNGTRSVSQAGLGVTGLGWLGLLIGDLVGRLVGVGHLFRLSWRSVIDELRPLNRAAIHDVLWTYRKLPLYDLPSALIDTLALGLPVPLISHAYGTEAAGYYALVTSVLTLPAGVVGRSVADVFHARMAHYARTDTAHIVRLFFLTSGTLLLVGLVPTTVMLFAGPALFPWLFGASWTTAGHMAAQLASWALASLIVAPVSRVIIVFQAQQLKLIYDVLALLGVLGPLLLAEPWRLSLLDAIKLVSIAQVLAYGVYFALLVHVVRHAVAAAQQRDRRASTSTRAWKAEDAKRGEAEDTD